VAAFVSSGWPLATNGFAWLAYANDDMTNYCLLAERLLHAGLYQAPTAADLARFADLSQNAWFIEMSSPRPGSQLFLAAVAAIAPRPILELFMPVLLAIGLALVA